MILHERLIYLRIILPIVLFAQLGLIYYNWYLYNQEKVNIILVISYLVIDVIVSCLMIIIGQYSTKQMLRHNLILSKER